MAATQLLDGFTPGVIGSSDPWLNPKAGKLSAWPSLARRGVMRKAFAWKEQT